MTKILEASGVGHAEVSKLDETVRERIKWPSTAAIQALDELVRRARFGVSIGSQVDCEACEGQGLIPDDTGLLIETCGVCEGAGRLVLAWVPRR